MNKITPFLWFEKDAVKIAEFYVSVFKGGKINSKRVMKNTPSGDVEIVEINIMGQDMTLMSAGPVFKLNEAISFVIPCENQEEIDYYWKKLSRDSRAEQCGWLKDKYGLSWQVVPKVLNKMLADKDGKKVARVTNAFLKMKKFDISKLEEAYNESG